MLRRDDVCHVKFSIKFLHIKVDDKTRFAVRLFVTTRKFKSNISTIQMNTEERNILIKKYAAGFDNVQTALSGFSQDDLTARPITGKWTASEIVHHLADSETQSALRLRKLISEDFPVIYGYDQELFVNKLRCNNRPVEPSLMAFKYARETTMQLLETMTENEWKREGWHNESGLYTAETWLEIYAEHAHEHANQISRLRNALQAVSSFKSQVSS
ncbi:MAG: DinB family protein [Pyrinomonadaceae bacterium]|nr:DinB family protein [Pyrinomonadaceae bacterium]